MGDLKKIGLLIKGGRFTKPVREIARYLSGKMEPDTRTHQVLTQIATWLVSIWVLV